MKMNIYKVREETLRLNLKAPDDYMKALNDNPELIANTANGVGSEESITYHATPDTIEFLNVNPSSHIHDWMYNFPEYFESWEEGMRWKKLADDWFHENMLTQINDSWGWMFRQTKKLRAWAYYQAVKNFGTKSFWAGKQKPADWRKHREVFK